MSYFKHTTSSCSKDYNSSFLQIEHFSIYDFVMTLRIRKDLLKQFLSEKKAFYAEESYSSISFSDSRVDSTYTNTVREILERSFVYSST